MPTMPIHQINALIVKNDNITVTMNAVAQTCSEPYFAPNIG